jgi:hypothetical protein
MSQDRLLSDTCRSLQAFALAHRRTEGVAANDNRSSVDGPAQQLFSNETHLDLPERRGQRQ